MMIVIGLNRVLLPQRYVAEPHVHLDSSIGIDVATYDGNDMGSPSAGERDDWGGVAAAVWAPPKRTRAVATDLPEVDEYIHKTPCGEFATSVCIGMRCSEDFPDKGRRREGDGRRDLHRLR
jgi:hypothetical protein